jgi:TPR repeat protein
MHTIAKVDGDSLFNAGHCYAAGTGVNQSWEKAADYYVKAARFGQFDAVIEMGTLWRRLLGTINHLVSRRSHVYGRQRCRAECMASDAVP